MEPLLLLHAFMGWTGKLEPFLPLLQDTCGLPSIDTNDHVTVTRHNVILLIKQCV